jgi:hypothetical protein
MFTGQANGRGQGHTRDHGHRLPAAVPAQQAEALIGADIAVDQRHTAASGRAPDHLSVGIADEVAEDTMDKAEVVALEGTEEMTMAIVDAGGMIAATAILATSGRIGLAAIGGGTATVAVPATIDDELTAGIGQYYSEKVAIAVMQEHACERAGRKKRGS